jgi:hypothetical protein
MPSSLNFGGYCVSQFEEINKMFVRKLFTTFVLSACAALSQIQPVVADPYDLDVHSDDAHIISSPAPYVPRDLRLQAFRTYISVKVYVNRNGSTTVTLMGTTGNYDADGIVLSTLRRWRFAPEYRDGQPIDSIKYVNVKI